MGVLLKLNLADRRDGVKKNDPRKSFFFVLDLFALFGGRRAGVSKDIRSHPITLGNAGVWFVGVSGCELKI